MQLDLSVHHSTAKPRKLLKNDGTIVTQVVESVRRAAPQLAQENVSFANGTALLTIKSFLSANAIRATDSMDRIDYCSSNNSPPCHLPKIRVPLWSPRWGRIISSVITRSTMSSRPAPTRTSWSLRVLNMAKHRACLANPYLRAVLEHGEEFLRLRGRLDPSEVLKIGRQAKVQKAKGKCCGDAEL